MQVENILKNKPFLLFLKYTAILDAISGVYNIEETKTYTVKVTKNPGNKM